ncbi:MAG: hypothetical protein BGO07_00915 [Alphaproteobacteria bacterium 40-19]|nr:MAG: hypothetical protein BGO07_00915 [Alphaproteobacteria bacterium 40-19]
MLYMHDLLQESGLMRFLPTALTRIPLSGLFLHTHGMTPGGLFVIKASPRYTEADLISKAFACGAVVVLKEGETVEFQRVEKGWIVSIPRILDQLLSLCDYFYPNRPDHTVAVTGTNGKTSVVHFLSQLWGWAGYPWATLGTIGALSSRPDFHFQTASLTTPDVVSTARFFHQADECGIQYAAVEASSHGLDQKRLGKGPFEVGIWTNFSQDHLDYHKTFQAYWQAKSRLFAIVAKYAIVHASVPDQDQLFEICRKKKVAVSLYGNPSCPAFYQPLKIQPDGAVIHIQIESFQWQGFIPLMGLFQYDNLVAALYAFYLMGGSLSKVGPFLGSITAPKGRLEYAGSHEGGRVYIDYAHSPDALKKVLETLRLHTKGKVGVIFGCGGDRDVGKRLFMGRVASDYADWAIVTNDNPRTEDPWKIAMDILKGCLKGELIFDRAEAIQKGIERLNQGDILLIAGKGHEQGQIVEDQIMPFCDLQQARQWLSL